MPKEKTSAQDEGFFFREDYAASAAYSQLSALLCSLFSCLLFSRFSFLCCHINLCDCSQLISHRSTLPVCSLARDEADAIYRCSDVIISYTHPTYNKHCVACVDIFFANKISKEYF